MTRQHAFAQAVALPHCGDWCQKWLLYLIVLIFVGDLERLRGSDHRLHGCEDVLIDQFGEAPFVLVRVAGAVDNPHLFDEGALPAFPSACGQMGRLYYSGIGQFHLNNTSHLSARLSPVDAAGNS